MELAKKIQTGSIPKLIFGLSAPAILSLLLNALNTAIDGMFVGNGVSTVALSAVTVSLGIVLIIQAFSLLIAAGTSASTALKLGKDDKASAERIIGNSITLSLILSVALTVIGLLAIKPLLLLYGASAENIGLAMEYATVILSGTVFFVLAQVTNNALKGMGYAKRAFVNFASSVIVNTILDYVFIFIFKWGVFGAALATVIGNIVCVLLAVQFLCSKKCMARLKLKNMGLQKEAVKTILSIGTPACIMQLALSMVSLTFNHVTASWGGTTAVAAYGIMYNIMMIVYMPIMGLGQGIQPIFGFNYSAQKYERVKQTLKCSITYATIFATVMFALIELFSGQIVGAFGGTDNPAFAEMAVPGLRLFSLMIPVVGFQMIGANYFQYVGKIKQSVILSSLRQLILLIPFVLVIPSFFGMTGIWIATPLADFIAFIVTVLFIRREFKEINFQINVSASPVAEKGATA